MSVVIAQGTEVIASLLQDHALLRCRQKRKFREFDGKHLCIIPAIFARFQHQGKETLPALFGDAIHFGPSSIVAIRASVGKYALLYKLIIYRLCVAHRACRATGLRIRSYPMI